MALREQGTIRVAGRVNDEAHTFSHARIVQPSGYASVHVVYDDVPEIRVPMFGVQGLTFIFLVRHEAFGMVWYQEAGQA